MAQAANSAVLQIDDGGGFVTVATTDIQTNLDHRNEETTEHGSDVQRTLTIQDAQVTISGNFNDSGSGLSGGQDDVLQALIAGTEVDVRLYPVGTSGTPKYFAFAAYVANFSPSFPATGGATWTATLQQSDGVAVTYGT